jgi:TPR repeat protein
MRSRDKKLMARIWGRPKAELDRKTRYALRELKEPLQLAAESGDAVAMSCLAYLLKQGLVKASKSREAGELIERAARLGEPSAQLEFAMTLREKNREVESATWLRRSAESGLVEGQFQYGVYMLRARTKRQREAGVGYLRRAHRRGHPSAAGWLAHHFEQAVPLSNRKAVHWTRLAAKRGDERAIYNLGVSYELGQGVRRDRKRALNLYRRAAALGVREAQAALRRLFALT